MGWHLPPALAPVLSDHAGTVDGDAAVRVYRHTKQSGVGLQICVTSCGYVVTQVPNNALL